MSTPSRFNRTRSSEGEPASISSEAPTQKTEVVRTPHTNHIHASNAQDLTALQNRLSKVQHERIQREFELKTTQKAIQECEEAARKLGINSLEEMEEFVRRLEAEDIAAQEKFEQELETEEALLQRISQQLADLERE